MAITGTGSIRWKRLPSGKPFGLGYDRYGASLAGRAPLQSAIKSFDRYVRAREALIRKALLNHFAEAA
jgi:hypothetical protein